VTIVEKPRVRTRVERLGRYSAVSVMSVVITQVLLQLGLAASMPAVAANLFAVGLSAIPAYLVNRGWVWGKQGKHSIAREIVPFWSYAFLGLAISTIAVAWADARWHSNVAVSIANIASFGVLWAAKFVLLDRWMFGDRGRRPLPPEAQGGAT
jgi:putative flippase GtrA